MPFTDITFTEICHCGLPNTEIIYDIINAILEAVSCLNHSYGSLLINNNIWSFNAFRFSITFIFLLLILL